MTQSVDELAGRLREAVEELNARRSDPAYKDGILNLGAYTESISSFEARGLMAPQWLVNARDSLAGELAVGQEAEARLAILVKTMKDLLAMVAEPPGPTVDPRPPRPRRRAPNGGHDDLSDTVPTMVWWADGTEIAVSKWTQVAKVACDYLLSRHPDVDPAALAVGRRRQFFHRDAGELLRPLRLKCGLYLEMRARSANMIHGSIMQLMDALGEPRESFHVEYLRPGDVPQSRLAQASETT